MKFKTRRAPGALDVAIVLLPLREQNILRSLKTRAKVFGRAKTGSLGQVTTNINGITRPRPDGGVTNETNALRYHNQAMRDFLTLFS